MQLIADVFGRAALGRQFYDLFEKVATTITREYIQEYRDHIANTGTPLSFLEMMTKVRCLNTELVLKAEWIREDYRVDRGYKSIRLTTGCKRIIKQSMTDFLYQSKSFERINDSRPGKLPLWVLGS